jgi:hypothetical protein
MGYLLQEWHLIDKLQMIYSKRVHLSNPSFSSNILWRDQAGDLLKYKQKDISKTNTFQSSILERDRDKTKSLSAFILETETRPRVLSTKWDPAPKIVWGCLENDYTDVFIGHKFRGWKKAIFSLSLYEFASLSQCSSVGVLNEVAQYRRQV